MTQFEFEAALRQLKQHNAELEAELLVKTIILEDMQASIEANQQINKRLEMSMECFDPASSYHCKADWEN